MGRKSKPLAIVDEIFEKKNQEVENFEEAEVVEDIVDGETVSDEVVEEQPAEKPKKAKGTKKNKEKKNTSVIQVLDNDTLRKLFTENGCVAQSKAKNTSSVVYQQWGTKSRVLQQKSAYQLLLTNGHADNKGTIIDTDNDDVARFTEWYNTLTDEQKGWVVGFSDIQNTMLSKSEMPRERTVKLTSYELLVAFIQYMAQFAENQPLVDAE